MYGTLFLFPLASLSLRRLASVEVGLSLLPMAISFIAISPFSGSISERLGKKRTISAGLALMGLGNLLLGSSFLADWFIAEEVGLLLTGVGMGMVVQDAQKLGELAGQRLLARIASPEGAAAPPQDLILTPRFVRGESTRRL